MTHLNIILNLLFNTVSALFIKLVGGVLERGLAFLEEILYTRNSPII